MPTKTTAAAPWQDLEKQAYHAFREWHIWLALRERELSMRPVVARGSSGRTNQRAPGAASAVETPERTTKEGVTS
jgi:hypothetical protein